jgi:cytidylate kinase
VGLRALRAGVSLEDGTALAALARDLPARFDGERVFLAEADVSAELRGETCADAASRVAVHPPLRAALLSRQRSFRVAPGLVADGRDMGTVVFPEARSKVFLTASLQERAERRYKQLIAKGLAANIATLLLEIEERDRRDRERAAAPLAAAPDALVIDTTGLGIEFVVAKVLEHYRGRG